MKRIQLILFVLLLVVSSVMVFASGSQEGSGRTDVDFWTNESDPPSVAAYTNMISSFEEENPEINIEMQFVTETGLLTKINTAMASGQNIDVFFANPVVARMAEEGLLLDLDPVIESVGGEEAFLNPTDLMKDSDGNVVGLPYAGGGPVFWLRKDLFEEAGVEIPSTDYNEVWSWDEAMSAIQAVHDPDNGVYGISIPAGLNTATAHYLQFFTHLNGWEFFDSELNVRMDNPRTVEAIEYYADLLAYAPPDATEMSWFETIDAFTAGRAATCIYWGRVLGRVYDEAPDLADKVIAVPLPSNTGHASGRVSADYYAIHKNSSHPDLARQWLEFLARPKIASMFLETVPGHLLPVTYAQSEALQKSQNPLLEQNRETIRVLFEITEYSHTPETKSGALINQSETGEYGGGTFNPYSGLGINSNLFAEAVQRVFINDETPAEVIRDTSETLVEMVEEASRDQ